MSELVNEWTSERVSDLWISPRIWPPMNVGAPGSGCPWSTCCWMHATFVILLAASANNINYQVAASVASRSNHIKIWLINKNRQDQRQQDQKAAKTAYRQLNKATTIGQGLAPPSGHSNNKWAATIPRSSRSRISQPHHKYWCFVDFSLNVLNMPSV